MSQDIMGDLLQQIREYWAGVVAEHDSRLSVPVAGPVTPEAWRDDDTTVRRAEHEGLPASA